MNKINGKYIIRCGSNDDIVTLLAIRKIIIPELIILYLDLTKFFINEDIKKPIEIRPVHPQTEINPNNPISSK